MFRRRNRGGNVPIPQIIEEETVEAERFISSYAKASILEAGDPANRLGRRQMMVTDVTSLQATDGRTLVGVRSFKSLGAKGSLFEQTDNPYLREGTAYVARIGIPLLGGLTIRRSVDVTGDFYPPNFHFIPKFADTSQERSVAISADEAFAAIKRFDELFFPVPNITNIVGLSPELASRVREAERVALDMSQGL